jgi:hypothetical protein
MELTRVVALIEGITLGALALDARDWLLAGSLVVLGCLDGLVGLGLVAVDEVRGRIGSGRHSIGDGLHICGG